MEKILTDQLEQIWFVTSLRVEVIMTNYKNDWRIACIFVPCLLHVNLWLSMQI